MGYTQKVPLGLIIFVLVKMGLFDAYPLGLLYGLKILTLLRSVRDSDLGTLTTMGLMAWGAPK